MNKLRSYFRNLSIHYRLLLAYSTAFFVVMGMSSLLIYSVIRTTIEKNIEKELMNSTNAILNMVKTAIDASTRNHLRAIAENNHDIVTDMYNTALQEGSISIDEAKEQAKQLLLSQNVGKNGYIYCINHEGIIQVHPKKELIGTDLSEHDFIRIQKLKKTGYIEYDWANPEEIKKRPKALYMSYFAPWDWIISVSSYREEFSQLLSVEDFKQNILSIKFGKTGYPYVIDSKGLLIIHPKLTGTNIYQSEDENGRQFIREICEKKNGKIIYPWKNPDELEARDKLVIFNYIPELDWIVASSSYLEEFYNPLTTITYSIGVAGLIMLILIVPLTWFISSRLARPLQEMINVFEKGALSGFSSRLDVKWGGEMDEVAENYNRFIDTLEATKKQLEESMDELENRVNDRTHELSTWIGELEKRNHEDSLIRKMSEIIQVCNSSEEIYKVMKDYFLLFFPNTTGCLYIYEKKEDTLDPVVLWGNPQRSDSFFQPEDCWALRQGKPYLVHSGHHTVLCNHMEGIENKDSLCAPLIVREEIIGLLHILSLRNSKLSSETDSSSVLEKKQGLSTIVSEHLAIALVNIRLRETLKRQSILDPLTGLYNRRFLNESLKQEEKRMIRDQFSVGILMVDVDYFKKINDTYGHECGDAVLKKLGWFLKNNFRGGDIVCRYGGEEFVLVLSHAGSDQTLLKAKEMCRAIREDLKIPWQKATHTITVSIGASLWNPGNSFEKALNHADDALYRAKVEGRDQAAWKSDLPLAVD